MTVAMVASPTQPSASDDMVIPSWTAEMNRLNSSFQRSRSLPVARPSRAICSMRLRRSRTRAYSDATKKAFAKTNTATTASRATTSTTSPSAPRKQCATPGRTLGCCLSLLYHRCDQIANVQEIEDASAQQGGRSQFALAKTERTKDQPRGEHRNASADERAHLVGRDCPVAKCQADRDRDAALEHHRSRYVAQRQGIFPLPHPDHAVHALGQLSRDRRDQERQ